MQMIHIFLIMLADETVLIAEPADNLQRMLNELNKQINTQKIGIQLSMYNHPTLQFLEMKNVLIITTNWSTMVTMLM